MPGTYTVKVEAPGFKKYKQINIGVAIQQCITIDDLVEVGHINETVTVTAQAAVLQTDNADSQWAA